MTGGVANRVPGAAPWLRLSPQAALAWSVLFAFSLLWSAVELSLRGPWLGITWVPDEGALRVERVDPDGPARGALAAGDRIVGLERDGQQIPLDSELLLDDPDIYSTFAEYDRFFARQGALYALVAAGRTVTLIHAGGRPTTITPLPSRPLRGLPAQFWFLTLFGVLVWQVGAGMWAYRREQVTGLVALTGFAYMLSSLAFSVYSARELLIDAALFRQLSGVNHVGNVLFSYAALALILQYPRRIGRLPWTPLCLLAGALTVVNELVRGFEWPLQTFHLPYFIPYLLGVWAAHLQWKATHGRPDERATLLWFLLSVFLSIGLVLVLYFIPELLGHAPLIPPWAGQLLLSGLYFGLLLGVLRFHLFELERWWFSAWLWFLGGALVLATDFVLTYFVHLNHAGALTLGLLAVGWIYFPARQWLWARFVRSPSERLESYLPLLLETFFAASNQQEFQRRWQGLLKQFFDPLAMASAEGSCECPALERNGLELRVPNPGHGDSHLRLSGRSRGNRLFTPHDVQLTSFVLALARKSLELRTAQERGATVERERIARDLHDDVAPQLLTLIHRATTPENGEAARNALRTLRESIYALSDPRDVPLDQLFADWRRECADRVEAAGGIHLDWRQPTSGVSLWVNSRQRLNLTRVLREALTNALRHARPTQIAIDIQTADGQLDVRLIHDGAAVPPAAWQAGNGLANMRTRIAELAGDIRWQAADAPQPGVEVRWIVRLDPPAGPSPA